MNQWIIMIVKVLLASCLLLLGSEVLVMWKLHVFFVKLGQIRTLPVVSCWDHNLGDDIVPHVPLRWIRRYYQVERSYNVIVSYNDIMGVAYDILISPSWCLHALVCLTNFLSWNQIGWRIVPWWRVLHLCWLQLCRVTPRLGLNMVAVHCFFLFGRGRVVLIIKKNPSKESSTSSNWQGERYSWTQASTKKKLRIFWILL